MKMIRFAILAAVVPLIAVSQARAADKTDREKLIGAWRLASIAGPDGKPVTTGLPIGMLIYTRDGHVSVQLMYPKSAGALSNEYVHNGYEASFGSYDVNDASHTVTHHVLGSNTGDLLVGKDLPRAYRFSADGHLILKSTRPDEHWSVRWEHY
jgi:Lipocalin-like domain